jgi:hypothetical protein
MEIILSAIAAGGLVGASDQYLCLLIVAIASKTGLIQLAGPMGFLSSWWFITSSAIFWLISIAPAYASLLTPGIMNVINAIHKFLSGFLIPLSSALVALASVGVITSLNPELQTMLDSLRIFNPDGGIGATGWAVSGASALVALSVTGIKALTKPMLSAATGTTGHLSAPISITIENILSILLMAGAYLLTKVDPWLLIVLLAVVIILSIILFINAIYQMVRLKRGIGKVLYLAQTNPKAGLAVVAEFFVWGVGWLAWKGWGRGVLMFLIWVLWVAFFISIQGIVIMVFSFVAPAIPFISFAAGAIMVIIFLAIGFGTSGALLKFVEDQLKVSVPVAVK